MNSKSHDLAKNTLILLIGKISTQFVSFLMIPLYTTYLIPSEYGIFDLLYTYVSLLIPIFNLQLENGMFRFLLDVRNEYSKKVKIFSTVLSASLFQIILLFIIYFFLGRYISIEYKNFVIILVAIGIIYNLLMEFTRGIGESIKYAFTSFLVTFLNILFNIIFIVYFNTGVVGMFYSSVISQLFGIAYLIVSNKVWKYIVLEIDRKLLSDILKYSIPLVPNTLSWWVLGASDRTIITRILGIAYNGIYSIANKFSAVLSMLYNVFNMSITESISIHINDKDRDVFLEEIINQTFRLFVSLGFLIISVLPFVFSYIVDSSYINAYNQIPILILAVLMQIVGSLYSVIYVALKKSKEIAKTSIYAAILNILFHLLLIKHISLYAASISTLLSFFFMAVYRYFHVRKFVNVSLSRFSIFMLILHGLLVIPAYYYNNLIIRIFALGFCIVFSIIVNKNIIKEFILIFLKNIFKINN